LAQINKNNIRAIGLMGGEPLLHKNIAEFFKISREIFPKENIVLWTNGILLPNMRDEFWQNCKKYNIQIQISHYPIKLNKSLIDEKANLYDVSVFYTELKTMWKNHLRPSRQKDKWFNWMVCPHYKCTYLLDGKIYMCTVCARVGDFNRSFGKNYEISQKDYIDIYKIKSAAKIVKFLSRPIPFCEYCDVLARQTGLPFKVSQKRIDEWT
jgi:hypothetical protein